MHMVEVAHSRSDVAKLVHLVRKRGHAVDFLQKNDIRGVPIQETRYLIQICHDFVTANRKREGSVKIPAVLNVQRNNFYRSLHEMFIIPHEIEPADFISSTQVAKYVTQVFDRSVMVISRGIPRRKC